jgi:group I intron endonuclease
MNLKARFGAHRQSLRRGDHVNTHLQRAWNLYGEEAFVFEVLEECEVGRLIKREQWWIDAGQPEYNLCPTAGSCLGRRHTPESRAKQSKSMMGNKNNLGRKDSAETRAKKSASMKGRPKNAEHRANLSAALKGRTTWNKGKPMRAETKARLSVAHTGKKHTAEHRASQSVAQLLRRAKERGEA